MISFPTFVFFIQGYSSPKGKPCIRPGKPKESYKNRTKSSNIKSFFFSLKKILYTVWFTFPVFETKNLQATFHRHQHTDVVKVEGPNLSEMFTAVTPNTQNNLSAKTIIQAIIIQAT